MDYYKLIKNELIDNEINKRVKDYSKNRYELEKYYNVGKLLIEAQGGEERAKYGDGLIKEYSERLTIELGKGFTITMLKRMRKFYLSIQKGAALSHQLTWSHYQEIMPLNDLNKMNYFIKVSERQNLGIRELRKKIKNKEYERLDENTKNKLIESTENSIEDLIKHPIIIRNTNNYEIISEKILKKLILEDIDNFLSELGEGFSYIANEYKIMIGNIPNYLDILLFNIKFNCYVVVELKIKKLKKEHIGQIEIYMNYIDKHLKNIYQDKTIGIIICKKNNKFIMEYCSDSRIFNTTYELV